MKPRVVVQPCELCEGEASLYCAADSAFLCWRCDRRVHSANFLVARHVRLAACSACRSPSAIPLSGPGSSDSDPTRPLICRSCIQPIISPSASASSPSSAALKLLGRWGRRMGLRNGRGRRCAEVAAHVVRACGAAVPLRVAMAAGMWFGVRRVRGGGGGGTSGGGMVLRRLERCSGVPAKVIVACESRIACAVGRRRLGAPNQALEEGSGECE